MHLFLYLFVYTCIYSPSFQSNLLCAGSSKANRQQQKYKTEQRVYRFPLKNIQWQEWRHLSQKCAADTVLHISWTSDIPHTQNQVILNVTNHRKKPSQPSHEQNRKRLEGLSNWNAAVNQKFITRQTCQESFEQKNCALAVSTGHKLAYIDVSTASQNYLLGNA